MKQLKIKQEFLDNIKNGIMDFYITKKDYGFKDWTKVELVVKQKHILENYDSGLCLNCRLTLSLWDIINCFKETLTVELKQTEMTAFEIGLKLSSEFGNLLEETEYENVKENSKKIVILENVINFVKDYFKQGDTLYWYDLRLVE